MLTSGFLRKKYNTLLTAGLLGWIISLVGELADGIFAGIFLGEEAVSAVSLVEPVFSILFFLCSFIAIGIATLYSRAAGAFDTDKASGLSGMGMIISVGGGILLAAAMILGEDAFFEFYSSTPVIEAYAREYYEVFPVMALIYPAYWLLYYLVTADGDAGLILATDISSAAGNVLLSLFFIDRFGVRGLAYGTVGSLLLSGIFIAAHFLRKSNSICFRRYFSWADLWDMLKIGSTCSLTTLYVAIIDIIMNKYVIAAFGDAYLPAYAVVNLILNFACCLSCAVDSAGPFISVAYGENNPLAMRRCLRIATRSTVIITAVFIAAMECLAGVIPNLYGITDPEVYAASVYTGRVLSFAYLGSAFVYEGIAYFPRVEKIFLGNALGIIYMLLAPVLFVFPLSKLFGYHGLVWGFLLTPFAALAFYVVYACIRYGAKKLPFLLPETDEKIFIHEFKAEPEEIPVLNGIVAEDLKSCGVSAEKSNLVQLMLEETILIVRDKNPGKKVLADCTITVGSDHIRLITRDNGVIFDITDTDARIESFGAYVAERLIQTSRESSYLTTISFNRNCYVWER